uniref:Hydroxyproline-rich glycoprotein n=1 Tax=Rhizophora mucronata TaxID=61149 RepID=A0A2P2JTG3_RHIMU
MQQNFHYPPHLNWHHQI